jgi:hypothetical protein
MRIKRWMNKNRFLENTIVEWMGDTEQTDDITVMV